MQIWPGLNGFKAFRLTAEVGASSVYTSTVVIIVCDAILACMEEELEDLGGFVKGEEKTSQNKLPNPNMFIC